IGFWYKDYKKATAGMKAFVVNRVGDWGFICGLSLLFWGMGGAWVNEGRYRPDFGPRFIAVEAEKLAEADEEEHEEKGKGHEQRGKEHEEKGEKAKEHGSLGGILEGTAHAADEHAKKAEPEKGGRAPAAGGTALLTMTTHPGAKVYLDFT